VMATRPPQLRSQPVNFSLACTADSTIGQ
jgi:hypothetical protein